MTEHGIEQWEHTQAELEIRRWLYSIGQWAPDAERNPPPSEAAGTLSDEQIDMVLSEEVVGRIGCYANERIYVVPVLYAYEGVYVYGHTGEGRKLRMMRSNPQVCFEVEQIDGLTEWRTVIATGQFEELHGPEADRAEELLLERLKSAMAAGALQPVAPERPASGEPRRAVVYRIALRERSGRFEKR